VSTRLKKELASLEENGGPTWCRKYRPFKLFKIKLFKIKPSQRISCNDSDLKL